MFVDTLEIKVKLLSERLYLNSYFWGKNIYFVLNPIYPGLFYLIFPVGADSAHRHICEGNTVDGHKNSKKVSCAQNIDNNKTLKFTRFQTCGTIGLFARFDFQRNGPNRPPPQGK